MAEILLSLTIIGVVAAITLPSLTGNINERTWNTQRKALYARFSQAMALMPALNGYGVGATDTDTINNATITFVTDGLSKVLKINNICDYEHLADCGIPDKVTPMGAVAEVISDFNATSGQYTSLAGFNSMFTDSVHDNYTCLQLDTKAAAFETANGESILVYYNPQCAADMGETDWYYTQPKMCANFIYDLNGSKGPNTVGKDIGFISALYPTDPVIVAPMPLPTDLTQPADQTEATQACMKNDRDARLPNKDELSAMFYNKNLIGISDNAYWSSTRISSGVNAGGAWYISISAGYLNDTPKTNRTPKTRCVKR